MVKVHMIGPGDEMVLGEKNKEALETEIDCDCCCPHVHLKARKQKQDACFAF
jgi:hypothetical protein